MNNCVGLPSHLSILRIRMIKTHTVEPSCAYENKSNSIFNSLYSKMNEEEVDKMLMYSSSRRVQNYIGLNFKTMPLSCKLELCLVVMQRPVLLKYRHCFLCI